MAAVTHFLKSGATTTRAAGVVFAGSRAAGCRRDPDFTVVAIRYLPAELASAPDGRNRLIEGVPRPCREILSPNYARSRFKRRIDDYLESRSLLGL